ncbi:hypothetical protein MPTK1_1g28980 [Marchantia polymorpha subsp. ruderalis]|uniref:HIT domain-containing protein n=2 Tax=Marchantia polymorpha TaxID=3197 RepID=A0AAF6AVE1_MARPO|nr:hypothetical protein MARPO_0107s0014 [Marchantia polymorpha]BBN00412.1 hypothetical protein Mp_1g28980 [Marchantia polymorpha subsp. ruderalis]|eukprot:PTQ31738.1 hypothetical protein MARPO_0107s0014 [Marchantia polymorpha]
MRCGLSFVGARGQFSLFSTFVGGEARRLFVKQSSSGGAVRMATTVKGPLEESSPQMDAYTFGPWKIDPKEVFLVTEHCYAFVNLRPVVPGHILT